MRLKYLLHGKSFTYLDIFFSFFSFIFLFAACCTDPCVENIETLAIYRVSPAYRSREISYFHSFTHSGLTSLNKINRSHHNANQKIKTKTPKYPYSYTHCKKKETNWVAESGIIKNAKLRKKCKIVKSSPSVAQITRLNPMLHIFLAGVHLVRPFLLHCRSLMFSGTEG